VFFLSEKREHIHPVMLNATFYVAISKLQAKLECSKSAAILYALGDGLFYNGMMSEDDHDLLAKRYGRKLKDVIAGGKENSNIPKLELEKQKREKCQASAQNARSNEQFEGIKETLKGKYEQWDSHPDLDWRFKTIAYAKKYPDLEYARLLIDKEKKCDIISQESSQKESAT
jgi:hypothetical protein